MTKKIKSRTHMVNPGARVVADLYQYEDGKKQLSANIQNVLSGDNETGSAYDGEYRIDDVNTTKGIDNVTVDNNTVNIYQSGERGSEPAKRSCACAADRSEQAKRSCDTDRSEPADGLFAADNISRDVLCTKQQSADRRRRSSHRR